METDDEPIMVFEVGKTYNFKKHLKVYKMHIVAVIDEGLYYAPLIVYRYWTHPSRGWEYGMDNAYMLTADVQRAEQILAKKRERKHNDVTQSLDGK